MQAVVVRAGGTGFRRTWLSACKVVQRRNKTRITPDEARQALHQLVLSGDEAEELRLALVQAAHSKEESLRSWYHWLSVAGLNSGASPVKAGYKAPLSTAEAMSNVVWLAPDGDASWQIATDPSSYISCLRSFHQTLVENFSRQMRGLSEVLSPFYPRNQNTVVAFSGAFGTGKTYSVKTWLAGFKWPTMSGVSAPDEVKRILRQKFPCVPYSALNIHSGVVTTWSTQKLPPGSVRVADGMFTVKKVQKLLADHVRLELMDSVADPIHGMNSVMCRSVSRGPHMSFADFAQSYVEACRLRQGILSDPAQSGVASYTLTEYRPNEVEGSRRQEIMTYKGGQIRVSDPAAYDRILESSPEATRIQLAVLGNTIVTRETIREWVTHSAPQYAGLIWANWLPYEGCTVAEAFAARMHATTDPRPGTSKKEVAMSGFHSYSSGDV